MKQIGTGLVMLALAAFVGCSGSNTSANHPGGASNATGKPIIGEPDDGFDLDPPTFETGIKEGEAKNVDIGIKRGKNFDQDVTLTFEKPPKGVTFDPANPVIKKSEKKVTVSVKVADSAALGHHDIKVGGKPATSGGSASAVLKIEVKEK